MKLQLAAWALCVPLLVFSQPTIDGDISDTQYFRLGESDIDGQNGYGDANDVGWLVTYTTTTDVYIGISGDLELNGNNIVIFMNFGGYGGRAAGATLGNGIGAFGSGMDGASMDMEVDYAIAVNKGYGGTNFFVDVARYGTGGIMASGNIGNTSSHSGDAESFDPSTPWSGSGNITVAFKSGFVDTTNNQHNGVEIHIPVSTMAGVSSGVTVQFFVLITNNVGDASNESIPAMDFAGNPGNDYNFNGLDQNLFTFDTTLPIELISFESEVQQGGVALNWTTASELNNSHFEIERSTDGSNWQVIGQVNGAGTTTSERTYSYLDTRPAPGTNYYRLKQVDLDGAYEYSEVVSAVLRTAGMLAFSPNPASDILNVPAGIDLRIFDLTGKTLLYTPATGTSIDISALAAGYYLVELNNGAERKVEKLVVE